jgi:thiol-disulfide isomerase/thioredoxin
MRRRLAALALLLACNNNGARPGETTPAGTPDRAEPAPAEPAPAVDGDPDAPSLAGAAAWLGVDAPIDIKSLRGQVVVIDFWTYCCINCMHVLPLLRDIEHEFAGQPLTVLGVHSAKFDAERDPQRIREAMKRYGVEHPVAVDSDMKIWDRYGASGWPTIVVIKPNGKVAGIAGGEPDGNLLRAVIRGVMADARADGTLSKEPRPIKPSVSSDSQGPLAYPGKVLALAERRPRRVRLRTPPRPRRSTATGKVRHAIGSGLRGWSDGSFAAATFDDPQGLAASAPTAAPSTSPTPATTSSASSTSRQSHRRDDRRHRRPRREAPLDETIKPARDLALRSPWDLALTPDHKRLIIALAGSHQLAALDLATLKIRRLSGSGRETITDGAAEVAAFSQPSGISVIGGAIYVADSEVSGVRAVSVADGLSRTIIGTGLFDFGDRDGAVTQALLQHPLHVLAIDKGTALLVADTYNNKLKRIDLKAGTIATFYSATGELALHEPAGLTREKSGTYVVADTNASRLLRLSADGKTATPITITGAPAPLVGAALPATPPAAGAPITARVALEGDPLRPAMVNLDLRLRRPRRPRVQRGLAVRPRGRAPAVDARAHELPRHRRRRPGIQARRQARPRRSTTTASRPPPSPASSSSTSAPSPATPCTTATAPRCAAATPSPCRSARGPAPRARRAICHRPHPRAAAQVNEPGAPSPGSPLPRGQSMGIFILPIFSRRSSSFGAADRPHRLLARAAHAAAAA